MAVRKRFSEQERALLASGQAIEVQNVTQWHAATIAPGAGITRDAQGWERIAATIDKTRGTVRAGDPWPVSPGHLRARPAADEAPRRACSTCGQPARFNRITQGFIHEDLDDEFDGPHGWHPVDQPGTLDTVTQ